MRRLAPLLGLFVAGCSAVGSSAPNRADQTTAPGTTLPFEIGVYQGSVAASKVRDYENFLGRPMDYINDTIPSESWDNMTNSSLYYYFELNWQSSGVDRIVLTIPMIPTFAKYDGPTLNDADASQALADGAAGANDAYWIRARQQLLAGGYTKNWVRLGWEMNGNWYNWRAVANPTAWVAYWRRIRGILLDDPNAHFKFDWNPTLADQAIAAETVYPGDDVVDAIGIDVYDSDYARYPAGSGNLAVQRDVWFNTVRDGPHGLSFYSNFARTHGKPLHIDEWGVGPASGHMGGDNPFFVESLVTWAKDPNNNVTLMMYFDDPTLMPGATAFPQSSQMIKSLLGP